MTVRPRLPRLVLRAIAALLLAIQGVVHLGLWLGGFSGIPVVGPMFLGGVVAALVLAVGVLITDHPFVLAAGVLLSLGQIAALAASSTIGLFGFETQWVWTGSQGAALLSELLAAIALIALARWRHSPELQPQQKQAILLRTGRKPA